MLIAKGATKMDIKEKEIKDEELENTNGGIKIVIDHDDSKFIQNLKNALSRLKKWRR